MHISASQQSNIVTFSLYPEETDRRTFRNASLVGDSASFCMPRDFDLRKVHPDLVGLASLIVAMPWVVKEISFETPVSSRFAEVVESNFKRKVLTSSYAITSREPGRRPGLSFSAGVDSTACLQILPEDSVPVFSHRVGKSKQPKGLYNDAAPVHAVKEIEKTGRQIFQIDSDLEYLRDPVGFPVDPSPGVPLVLMGDYLDLDSIAFGTISEAAYRTGTEHFIDYSERSVFRMWAEVFAAAGVSYFNVVAPMSEMCTMRLSRASEFGHLAQPCVRGQVGKPCGLCVKCFRKAITEASLNGKWPNDKEMAAYFASRPINSYLKKVPIRLELILSDALSRYDGNEPRLLALKRRLAPEMNDTSFLHGWYEPGMRAMVPEKYYEDTVARINKHIPMMTREQEAAFEGFDIRPKVEALTSSDLPDEFNEILDAGDKSMDPAAVASSMRGKLSRLLR